MIGTKIAGGPSSRVAALLLGLACVVGCQGETREASATHSAGDAGGEADTSGGATNGSASAGEAQTAAASGSATAPDSAASSAALRALEPIALPDVSGRIDHLAVDLAGRRLFVAALGNDTVEVLSVDGRVVLQTLRGVDEPQGIVWLPTRGELWVTSGGRGTCVAFGGDPLTEVARVELGSDADNLRATTDGTRLFAGCGDGAVVAIDVAARREVGRCALPAHPESLQLEREGGRLFVNVPGAHAIAAVGQATLSVRASWTPGAGSSNFPMALDEGRGRLYVGLRRPASLALLDAGSGDVVATLDAVGDVDDLFLDEARSRLYAVGGEGFVDVFAPLDAGVPARTGRVRSASGARTGLFVPEWDRLFVAAPRLGGESARVLVFEAR